MARFPIGRKTKTNRHCRRKKIRQFRKGSRLAGETLETLESRLLLFSDPIQMALADSEGLGLTQVVEQENSDDTLVLLNDSHNELATMSPSVVEAPLIKSGLAGFATVITSVETSRSHLAQAAGIFGVGLNGGADIGGNTLSVEASTSFTLETGAIISTRQTSGDVLTGDSGDVTGEFFRVKQAAELLGVVPNTVRAWGASGKLPEYRHPVNNYRLISHDISPRCFALRPTND